MVNALRKRLPALRLTIRTTIASAFFERRVTGPYELQPVAFDFGMLMSSAWDARVEDSATAYRRLHADWQANTLAEAENIRAIAPDLVLANIPYLSLASAAHAGVPSAALCCLNWADIYWHYFHGRREAPVIHRHMLAAYNCAALFLRPEPSMPMPGIHRRVPIGPIAATGRDQRRKIRRQLGLSRQDRLVMVGFGGIDTRFTIGHWPRVDGVHWLVQSDLCSAHPDAVDRDALGVDFVDLLRSCDALLTKPGYASFVEAACNGVPVLYVARGDWPEERYLISWLTNNGRCRRLDRRQFECGAIGAELDALLALPARPPVLATGPDEAAELLMQTLDASISGSRR